MVWWIKGLNYYALSNNLICFSLILSFQMEFFLWYIVLLFWCLSFCYCTFPHQKLFTVHFHIVPVLVDTAGCRCTFAFIFKLGTLFKEYGAIDSLREPFVDLEILHGPFLTLFCLKMCSTMQAWSAFASSLSQLPFSYYYKRKVYCSSILDLTKVPGCKNHQAKQRAIENVGVCVSEWLSNTISRNDCITVSFAVQLVSNFLPSQTERRPNWVACWLTNNC